MSRRQMEGENRERRKDAGQARQEGNTAPEVKVTQGASKQRQHLRRSEEYEVSGDARSQGKR